MYVKIDYVQALTSIHVIYTNLYFFVFDTYLILSITWHGEHINKRVIGKENKM
jgi:hypothetical protein